MECLECMDTRHKGRTFQTLWRPITIMATDIIPIIGAGDVVEDELQDTIVVVITTTLIAIMTGL